MVATLNGISNQRYARFRAPFDNLLINGGFDFFQRQDPSSAKALVDDDYTGPDRWYGLIQGAGATSERVNVSGTRKASHAIKLIAGGTSNRFGIAQIIENQLCSYLISEPLFLKFRAFADLNAGSGSIDVRYAVLEWTGTADTVTSELVNDWTSGTFTKGNFFVNDANLTILATDVVSATHNAWTEVTLSAGSVSSSMKNLILFIWHEDVPANANDFIQLTECDLYMGNAGREWRNRNPQQELAYCMRFYQKSYPVDEDPEQDAGSEPRQTLSGIQTFLGFNNGTLGNIGRGTVRLPVVMRTGPSATIRNYYSGNTNQVAQVSSGLDESATIHVVDSKVLSVGINDATINNGMPNVFRYHYTLEAEL